MANVQNLAPFNDTEEGRARAREQGRKGGLARAKKYEAKRSIAVKSGEEVALQLEVVARSFSREDLGQNAAAVASLLLGRIAAGEIEISGRDVAGLLDVLVTVVRLEEGLATSHHATG